MKFGWPTPGPPNTATTVLSAPGDSVQVGPLPEQSPAQETKVWPVAGVAVIVTSPPVHAYCVWYVVPPASPEPLELVTGTPHPTSTAAGVSVQLTIPPLIGAAPVAVSEPPTGGLVTFTKKYAPAFPAAAPLDAPVAGDLARKQPVSAAREMSRTVSEFRDMGLRR